MFQYKLKTYANLSIIYQERTFTERRTFHQFAILLKEVIQSGSFPGIFVKCFEAIIL